jgi:hypothetical protein
MLVSADVQRIPAALSSAQVLVLSGDMLYLPIAIKMHAYP